MTDATPPEPRHRSRVPFRRWLATGVAAVLAVIAGLLIWKATLGHSSDAPAISIPGGRPQAAGAVIPHVPLGTAFYTDTFPLCTSTGAPVTVQQVQPIRPTTAVKVGWAVHHGPFSGVDSGNGPIRLAGFSHQPVTGKCGTAFSMIAVSVTANAPAGVEGFEVVTSGGTVTLPFSLVTCPGAKCPHLIPGQPG